MLRETKDVTDRSRLILVGIFYLIAFPLYGGGQNLMQRDWPFVGVSLILVSSVVVMAIGFFLRAIIRRTSPTIAATVLAGRLMEGVLLGAGGVAFVLFGGTEDAQNLNLAAYHGGMIILGVAGIVLSVWLFTTKEVPRLLAAFGVVGYVSLASAMIVERLGNDALSLKFLAVAGLFEVSFALWLIFRGFKTAIAKSTD